MFKGVLDLPNVFKLGKARDLLESDSLLEHGLLVLLEFPLPFQLSLSGRLLLPPDSLLIGEYLLGLDPELLEQLMLPGELLLLEDDLLADPHLRERHLFGVTRE